MWETLIIHHSKKHRTECEIAPYFQWKTCQRSLYIGDLRQPGIRRHLAGYETFCGYAAYIFLLEVVTGVRSSLFAETEVMHQFKLHFANQNVPPSPFGDYLSRLREDLIADAKFVRRNYLTNLGDQSYGGIAHRLLGHRKEVVLLGSGQLAEKVLPFLKKGGREVLLAARNPIRRLALAKKHGCPSVSLTELNEHRIANLVVAAPVSIAFALPAIEEGACIVDLRDDDCKDQFPEIYEYHSFHEILKTLDRTRERHDLLRQKLRHVMQDLADKRKMARVELIHGWEDIPSIAV